MKRWLALPIGISVALWAGWALLSGPSELPGLSGPQPGTAVSAGSDAEPHANIDEASRARLEAILREAGREGSAGAGAEGAP